MEGKCCPNMIFTVSPKQPTYNGKRILVLSVITETYHPPHFPLNNEVRFGTSDLEEQVSTSQHTTHLCQGQTVCTSRGLCWICAYNPRLYQSSERKRTRNNYPQLVCHNTSINRAVEYYTVASSSLERVSRYLFPDATKSTK